MFLELFASLICATATPQVSAAPAAAAKATPVAVASQEKQPTVAIVNFSHCIADSKLGKQEQASFESLKTQMTQSLENLEKQINEISVKFNDREFLDGLSPEAEEELKTKYRSLNEELSHHQNQYYQVMSQVNQQIVQKLNNAICSAAESVARAQNISLVVNKEACFFYAETLDITSLVTAEMDKNFTPAQQAPQPNLEAKVEAAADSSTEVTQAE